MHRELHLRVFRVLEDADESGELVVPEFDMEAGEALPEPPRTAHDPPSGWRWQCHECGHLNGGWEPCETCGTPREDEWG